MCYKMLRSAHATGMPGNIAQAKILTRCMFSIWHKDPNV